MTLLILYSSSVVEELHRLFNLSSAYMKKKNRKNDGKKNLIRQIKKRIQCLAADYKENTMVASLAMNIDNTIPEQILTLRRDNIMVVISGLQASVRTKEDGNKYEERL